MNRITSNILKNSALKRQFLQISNKINQKQHPLQHTLSNEIVNQVKIEYKKLSENTASINDNKSIISEYLELKKLSKDQDEINEITELLTEINDEIENLEHSIEKFDENLIKNVCPELIDWAVEESEKEFENSQSQNWDLQLEGCKLQIIGGAGGLEAQLFGDQLFEGYKKFIQDMGWEWETMRDDDDEDLEEEVSLTDEDRNNKILKVYGEVAYHYLKQEHGVHRVQRVPFNSSRIQTSACAVNVVPCFFTESEKEGFGIFSNRDDKIVDYLLKSPEIKIVSFRRASGKGGQSVNTGNNARRVTHLPTGIVVEGNKKAEFQCLAEAGHNLRQELMRYAFETRNAALVDRKVKSLDRSDKIRTYNFAQKRITDHRLPKKYEVSNDCEAWIAQGQFEHFIEPMMEITEYEDNMKILDKTIQKLKMKKMPRHKKSFNHTQISEQEVLNSKYLVDLQTSFPVNAIANKDSALTLEKLKSELKLEEGQKIYKNLRKLKRRSIKLGDAAAQGLEDISNREPRKSIAGIENMNPSKMEMVATFIDEGDVDQLGQLDLELFDDDDDKDARFSKQRREHLLQEVWDKQYQHHMQTYEQAVERVACRLAKSAKIDEVSKAIYLDTKNYSYYINRAKLFHQLKTEEGFDQALVNLEHALNQINVLENSQSQKANEEQDNENDKSSPEIPTINVGNHLHNHNHEEFSNLRYQINQLILEYTIDWGNFELITNKNIETAKKIYIEALENPTCNENKNLDIQLKIAECLLAKNKRSECLNLLNYLCSRWNKRCDLLLMRARLHGKSMNTKYQYEDVKRALEIDNNNALANQFYKELQERSRELYHEALKLANDQQFWAAHQKINLGIEILPDKIEFYLLRAMLKRMIGKFTDAIDDLEKVLGWPDPEVVKTGGEEKGVPKKSIFVTQNFETIPEQSEKEGEENESDIITDPNPVGPPSSEIDIDQVIMLNQVRKNEAQHQILLTLNDLACEVAEFDLNKALSILDTIINQNSDPEITGPLNISHLYSNRAKIYTKLGFLERALIDYETAFEISNGLDPQIKKDISYLNFKMGNSICQQHHKVGNWEAAHEKFTKAINWYEGDLRYYLRRANARYMLRDIEGAKVDCEAVVRLYEMLVSGKQKSTTATTQTGTRTRPDTVSTSTALTVSAIVNYSTNSENKLNLDPNNNPEIPTCNPKNLDLDSILSDLNKLCLILHGQQYKAINFNSKVFVSKVKIIGN